MTKADTTYTEKIGATERKAVLIGGAVRHLHAQSPLGTSYMPHEGGQEKGGQGHHDGFALHGLTMQIDIPIR